MSENILRSYVELPNRSDGDPPYAILISYRPLYESCYFCAASFLLFFLVMITTETLLPVDGKIQ